MGDIKQVEGGKVIHRGHFLEQKVHGGGRRWGGYDSDSALREWALRSRLGSMLGPQGQHGKGKRF